MLSAPSISGTLPDGGPFKISVNPDYRKPPNSTEPDPDLTLKHEIEFFTKYGKNTKIESVPFLYPQDVPGALPPKPKSEAENTKAKPKPEAENTKPEPKAESKPEPKSEATPPPVVNRAATNGKTTKRSSHMQGPMAILTPCSNSHPFDERRIIVTRDEERAIKFGRAVARFQPAQNNAIFDCKVLSRNHAILWYEDDQFYIKDTRSSNGTFVNNQRLSSSGEESTPRVLHSGDILQLGVDIIDHAKNVACGCTIAIVRLIDERGEECIGNDDASLSERLPMNFMERLPTNCTLITHEKLFKLSQYMKEAQYREQLFTERLRNLESVLVTTQEAAESGWQALINEERLLSRIESLETQLGLYKTKTVASADDLQEQMRQLIEDRTKAELAAKDSLKKAEDQIYEANMKVHDMERMLVAMDENSQLLNSNNTALEEENRRQADDLDKLIECYKQQSTELTSLKEQLKEAKKAAATFSVTRIEAPKKEDEQMENGVPEALTSSTTQNGSSPKANSSSPKPEEKEPTKPAVFLQEAEVQTDPIPIEKVELPPVQKEEEKVEKVPKIQRDLNAESQVLLVSLVPFVFFLYLIIVLPIKLLKSRFGGSGAGNSSVVIDQQPQPTKKTNGKKGNKENLKKAQ